MVDWAQARLAEHLQEIKRRLDLRLERAEAARAWAFASAYFRSVPPEDLGAADQDSLYGQCLSLLRFAADRQPGDSKVRAFNPNPDADGWKCRHTVVEVVTDDMPFLVDSLTAELNVLDLLVHLVVHPVLAMRRDAEGRLLDVLDPGRAGAPDGTGSSSADDGGRIIMESVMHIEVDAQARRSDLDRIMERMQAVLADVRATVTDWRAMLSRADAVAAALSSAALPALPEAGTPPSEVAAFLAWLAADNFTFLGYRCYSLDPDSPGDMTVDANAGLGLLRDAEVRVFESMRRLSTMPQRIQEFARGSDTLLIAKSNIRATVHRAVRMDSVVVKRFDDSGRPAGLHLFMGLFTAQAFRAHPREVPVLRRTVAQVVDRAGFRSDSHDGNRLLHILDGLPREELFQVSADDLYRTALGILHLQERQRVALFARHDEFERFVSCLVYLPRDRYTTNMRHICQRILEQAFEGTVSAYYTQISDAPLARLHVIIETLPGAARRVDIAAVEARLADATLSWTDHLRRALIEAMGEATGLAAARRFAEAFPAGYSDRFDVHTAVADMGRIDRALQQDRILVHLYRPVEAGPGEVRLKVYSPDRMVPLSEVLPILENMGFSVQSEVPFRILPSEGSRPVWIHDFGLAGEAAGVDLERRRHALETTFHHVWSGRIDNDGFNRLVALAGLGWREVVVFRAYARYLKQVGFPFSEGYMVGALAAHAGISADLIGLFQDRFDPDLGGDRASRAHQRMDAVEAALEGVSSADEDRILRRLFDLILHTTRTNFYQVGRDGQPRPHLSLKIATRALEGLPEPKPWVETFVFSPEVEAVHLRGGPVARGGIRWSDRPEDFRTEILGLVKAQMVKNAVIVPVGAKGGFVVRRPPPPSAGPEAAREAGIAAYQCMMRGLLDITDNRDGDRVVPPPRVVRHDDDDPYLVVAADKGTATFSDIANAISAEYDHWLGDAFASGGSNGYDHKAMGITARGAWESVKRHFRELGVDVQREPVTVAGIGSMAGDVFGNGLLMSRTLKLQAAFDGSHIFLDPDPDPAASFAERDRLFRLARSTWADYDASLISAGGGVFRRDSKRIQLTDRVRQMLDLTAESLPPTELIKAILAMPVDLIWFGGIGTYVKARAESHAEVGDRANDGCRVDAEDLRARVIGEGANLGLTQRGRIAFALNGGRLNTDAIDNSGGVDCSDHEVNIKILLNHEVAEGRLSTEDRNALLEAMTDDVARLVLRDNYLQTQAISLVAAQGADILDQQVRLMRRLERAGRLNRSLEDLPDDETLAERLAQRRGLLRPEIAVLLSVAKLWLYDEIVASDLPDDPLLRQGLATYFPEAVCERFAEAVPRHRLAREIIATEATNSLVNRVGGSFVPAMMERTGRSVLDVVRAYLICREVFGLVEVWTWIEGCDLQISAETQIEMLLAVNGLMVRTVGWVLRNGQRPLSIRGETDRLRPTAEALSRLPGRVLPETVADPLFSYRFRLSTRKVPDHLAERIAYLPVLASAPEVARLTETTGAAVDVAARVLFTVGARLRFDWLQGQARPLAVGSHWQKLAVGALVEDLRAQQEMLAAQILRADPDTAAVDAAAAVEGWVSGRADLVDSAQTVVQEMSGVERIDLAMLAVATRQLRALIDAG